MGRYATCLRANGRPPSSGGGPSTRRCSGPGAPADDGVLLSFAASPPVAVRIEAQSLVLHHPPGDLRLARRAGAARDLDARAPWRAHGALGSPRRLRPPPLADAQVRCRGEGRQALGLDRRQHHPAVRVREAGLCRHRLVALLEAMKQKGVPATPSRHRHHADHRGRPLLQPDIGQTALMLATWGSLLFPLGHFLVRHRRAWGRGRRPAVRAYTVFPHFAKRVDSFLNPEDGNTYQVDKALGSLMEGGWFGRGPGRSLARKSSPTPMLTMCSRPPPASSASCSASSSWR